MDFLSRRVVLICVSCSVGRTHIYTHTLLLTHIVKRLLQAWIFKRYDETRGTKKVLRNRVQNYEKSFDDGMDVSIDLKIKTTDTSKKKK